MPKGSDDTLSTPDDNGRRGADDPATHDLGDDRGGLRPPGASDDPATHHLADDRGGERLQLVLNERSGQWIFTDDRIEHQHWLDDHGRHGGEVLVAAAAADDRVVPVYRFHDAASDVYFWTTDDALKNELASHHPELEFHGEAFKAFADDHGGRHSAIGLVWDSQAGPYGNFIYLPDDDAVRLAGQSDSDALVYLGVSFYI